MALHSCVVLYTEPRYILEIGVTCTVCNILHGWSRGQKNEQQNNVPSPKKSAAASYQGAGLLRRLADKDPHTHTHTLSPTQTFSRAFCHKK